MSGFFKDFPDNRFFEGKVEMISLPVHYQMEGVVFVDECLLYLTNEVDNGFFSALHQLRICE